MDSFIKPSLYKQVLNESLYQQGLNYLSNGSTMQQHELNSSDEVNTTNNVSIEYVGNFLMCVLGLPGNLLVITVYAWKMTTSTRVYMFALAVDDLTVCICGIVLTTVKLEYISLGTTLYGLCASVTFSIFLLAFVSIERLLAVRRPHTFSLNPIRAKRALVIIAVVAAVIAMVVIVGQIKHSRLLFRIIPAVVISATVVVMIVCYTLMAITMLMNIRTAHRTVGIANSTPVPGLSKVPTVAYISNGKATADVILNKNSPVSGSRKTTANQVKTYKGVSALFLTTVVFIACWVPHWLSDIGLDVPADGRRIFVLNSVVNPFLYSVVSPMFRDDVRQFYRKVRTRLASCH